MFANLKNVLKIPDLRNKVLFTLGMIALYRLGANIPVPGIDLGQVAQLQEQAQTQGAIGFLNLFSGGALSSFAVFALGIMPYITASIIMQVLGVAIPKLQEWQDQGAVGQRKITQWTRYLALAIATAAGHRPDLHLRPGLRRLAARPERAQRPAPARRAPRTGAT